VSRRSALGGIAALAAGAAAGYVLEKWLARRYLPRPSADETIDVDVARREIVDSFDGTTLVVARTGRPGGPAVVFAHGILESAAVWHYQLRDPALGDRCALLAYDARGHGRSGPARGDAGTTPFTIRTQARDLAAVLYAKTSGPVVVVGHSMGGMAIQGLWDAGLPDEARERVAGVVLVNTTFTAELAGWRGAGTRSERAYERLEDIAQRLVGSERLVEALRPKDSDLALVAARTVYGRGPRPSHLDASVRMYRDTPSATIAASVDLSRADLYHVLPRVDVPALVVAGSRDNVTPAFLSEEMASRIPRAELVVFEDCGHMAPFERHHELNTLIAKFCEQVL
jgi:pimeloyl-ACP methyl ester carboxylesterase